MPELPDQDSLTSGADAPEPRAPSLREIAEAAWDEGSSTETAESASDRGDGRDNRGRFAPKEREQETGEAEREAPSPVKTAEAQERPDPAAQTGASNQVPEHWSAEAKADFAKLPPEGQSILLRRHQEMEADYTRKSQANAQAVQAIQALTPIFQDPDISRSMRESNLTPVAAIHDWARLHKAAVSANPQDKASALYEIAQRMGFDPAKIFAVNRQPDPNVPEALRNDPTFKYVANLTDRTTSDLQALRAELHSFRQAETQRLEQDAVRVTRNSIDAFADEKGKDGQPLRPYFDYVLPFIIDAFRLNPNADIGQVYDQACWANADVRKHMLEAQTRSAQQAASNQRAAQAARSNVRGVTSPVSKPSQDRKGNGSLRDTLENSADEVGF